MLERRNIESTWLNYMQHVVDQGFAKQNNSIENKQCTEQNVLQWNEKQVTKKHTTLISFGKNNRTNSCFKRIFFIV